MVIIKMAKPLTLLQILKRRGFLEGPQFGSDQGATAQSELNELGKRLCSEEIDAYVILRAGTTSGSSGRRTEYRTYYRPLKR